MMRERKGLDPYGRGCREEEGGVEKRKMVIRISEEIYFQ